MRWIAIAVLAGCWTSSPRSVPSRTEPATERCESFREETRGYRGLPQMDAAAALPLRPAMKLLPADWMSGPHSNIDAACEDCESQSGAGRFGALAMGGRHLSLRIGEQWWSIDLSINDTCYVAADPPIVRDLLQASRGDELFLRITAVCDQPQPFGESEQPFGDPEPERIEYVAICGTGASGRPSCVQADFGLTAYTAEYSAHTRLDLTCDGIATFTSWDGTDGTGYKYAHASRTIELP
jgi:hypothetical protein